MSSAELKARSRLLGKAAWCFAFGLLGMAGAVSCAQLMGDVQLDPPSPDGRLPGSDTAIGGLNPTNGGSCEPGATRCDGTLVEICVRVTPERDAGWLPQQDCFTSELCVDGSPAHCLTRTCDRGEVSCLDAVPRVCNAGQSGWDARAACENAAHCSTNASECGGMAPCCLDAPCSAGTLRCNQAGLERCLPDESGWSSVATCATADLCLGGLAECQSGRACTCPPPICKVGETRCAGAALERCNAGQTGWDVQSTCATPELCLSAIGNSTSVCEPPKCAVGDHVCTDLGVLQSCRADRTGFDDQATCDGPAFCNAADGVCNPAPCVAGEVICNGAQIQVCAPDRSGFTDFGPACATAALCNDADPAAVRCDDPRCSVNQFDCFSSSQLQTCNDGRTAFVPAGLPCLRPDLCSADRRRCDFCVPGRQECTIDQSSSRVCSITGNFFGPETFCPLGCIAATGQCRTCQFGSYTCTNGNLSRCNDGRSFTPLNRATDCSGANQVSCINGIATPSNCGDGCNITRNQCNQCSGTERQCVGDGFQACTNGVFGAVQDCLPGSSCVGQGVCACADGELRCVGEALQVCNGTAFVPTTEQCRGEDGDILTTCVDGDVVEDRCEDNDECEDSRGSECDD